MHITSIVQSYYSYIRTTQRCFRGWTCPGGSPPRKQVLLSEPGVSPGPLLSLCFPLGVCGLAGRPPSSVPHPIQRAHRTGGSQSGGPFPGKSPDVACPENPRKAARCPEEEVVGMASSQSRLFLTSLGAVLVQPPWNGSVKSRSTLLVLRSLYFSESLGRERTARQHDRHVVRLG